MNDYIHNFRTNQNLKLLLIKKIPFVKDDDIRSKSRVNPDKSNKLIFYKGLNYKIGDKGSKSIYCKFCYSVKCIYILRISMNDCYRSLNYFSFDCNEARFELSL
jgi:hypothetical protein